MVADCSGLKLTFGIHPVRIQVRQHRLIAELLDGLWRLMVYLEDTARSPPPGTFVVHGFVNAPASGRFGVRVVSDGTREDDWGRQLEGIEGGTFLIRRAGRIDLGKVGGRARYGVRSGRQLNWPGKSSWRA